MFTGLIEAVGELTERRPSAAGVRIVIRTVLGRDLTVGDSVAVNGVCLTATHVDADSFSADVGPETMAVTTIGSLKAGSLVNLERPLRLDSRIGGHFVQGHVDATGEIVQIRSESEFQWIAIQFPTHLARYLVQKGSIAVDGISLTIAHLGADRFDVQIVPYTLDHTNLKAARRGDRVNLETDMLGKYAVRLAEMAEAAFTKAGDGR